jgi:poly(A) polymerase
MVAAADVPTSRMEAPARRRMLYRLGAERFRDLTLLAWSRALAAAKETPPGDAKAWRGHLAAAAEWQPLELPVKGRDVLALGIPAGSDVGRLLAALEAWWIEEDFRPDRAACLARLAALAKAAGKR